MKRYMCFIFFLLFLVSCSSKENDEEKTETINTIETSLPILNDSDVSWDNDVFNNSLSSYYYENNGDFIYNPYDDCFYISLLGEHLLDEYGRINYIEEYPFDPPMIEQFCKINAKTNEVTKLLDYHVENLVYNEGYVYFIDKDMIKRIQNSIIEDVFVFSAVYSGNFYVDNEKLYIINRQDGVFVFNLENMQEIENMRFHQKDANYQINNDTIYAFSNSGFYWRNSTNKINSYEYTYDLLKDFYKAEMHTRSFFLNGNLFVKTIQDNSLFLIDLENDTIEVIASDVYEYTIYDNFVYYISESEDALKRYDISTKESEMIISFLENEDQGIYNPDYYGFENLIDVKFLNNRCFLYVAGMKSYSRPRVAELDLVNKNVVYLTDYFDKKQNILTSFYGNTFSFEYPNDYSVFIDVGSSGGTIISNYEKHLRLQINGMSMRYADKEDAFKDVTKQGLPIYYQYEENGMLAIITKNNEDFVRISIAGGLKNIKRNEAEILDILKSICVYENDN